LSEVPKDLLYTEEHEYLAATPQAGVYTVGITDYAQGELGDVVFVELPEPGATFGRMATFGTIEAVKAVSDLYCPVAGEVAEVNDSIGADPSVVNSDPYGKGWLIRLKVADEKDLGSLLDADRYREHVDG
jgi:glycine cleavage system H protein